MRAQPDRLEDKKFLYQLSDNLDSSYARVHLDECGDWNIFGRKGKIFTGCKKWYLYTNPENRRIWNNIKKRLSFMKVHQDGDEEGILVSEKALSTRQAEVVRKVLQLRKRQVLTEEDRALLKIRFKSSSPEALGASRID